MTIQAAVRCSLMVAALALVGASDVEAGRWAGGGCGYGGGCGTVHAGGCGGYRGGCGRVRRRVRCRGHRRVACGHAGGCGYGNACGTYAAPAACTTGCAPTCAAPAYVAPVAAPSCAAPTTPDEYTSEYGNRTYRSNTVQGQVMAPVPGNTSAGRGYPTPEEVDTNDTNDNNEGDMERNR